MPQVHEFVYNFTFSFSDIKIQLDKLKKDGCYYIWISFYPYFCPKSKLYSISNFPEFIVPLLLLLACDVSSIISRFFLTIARKQMEMDRRSGAQKSSARLWHLLMWAPGKSSSDSSTFSQQKHVRLKRSSCRPPSVVEHLLTNGTVFTTHCSCYQHELADTHMVLPASPSLMQFVSIVKKAVIVLSVGNVLPWSIYNESTTLLARQTTYIDHLAIQ